MNMYIIYIAVIKRVVKERINLHCYNKSAGSHYFSKTDCQEIDNSKTLGENASGRKM